VRGLLTHTHVYTHTHTHAYILDCNIYRSLYGMGSHAFGDVRVVCEGNVSFVCVCVCVCVSVCVNER